MDLQEMSYENTNWFWMKFDEELWLRRFLRRLNDHQLFIKTLLTELISNLIIIKIIIFAAIGLLPSGSGYFTCIQNMKLVTNKFKSGGLHEKHVVATWNLGNHLSICL